MTTAEQVSSSPEVEALRLREWETRLKEAEALLIARNTALDLTGELLAKAIVEMEAQTIAHEADMARERAEVVETLAKLNKALDDAQAAQVSASQVIQRAAEREAA